MGGSQPRIGLNLKVAQKQILTPGLVQMVSVLALNRLELREMINEEMIANPVLEEVPEDVPSVDEVAQKVESNGTAELLPGEDHAENGNRDSFEEIDFGSFFRDYLDPGFKAPAGEVYEKTSFENFLSQPSSLADHLEWQLSVSKCSEAVRNAADSIIGNLNEDGYLTTTVEEIARSGGHSPADVEAALTLVQEFDPLGVAARDVRRAQTPGGPGGVQAARV